MLHLSSARADILIVDDHPLFLSGFAHMAQALRPDWTLHTAASTAEALRHLHANPPHLALIDVGLRGEDGFSLLRSMADHWPGLPAVLISGRDDAAMRVRARASGAAGFIAKTASPEAIVGMLETVLQGVCGRPFLCKGCGSRNLIRCESSRVSGLLVRHAATGPDGFRDPHPNG